MEHELQELREENALLRQRLAEAEALLYLQDRMIRGDLPAIAKGAN